jgi:alpha-tubulin suppressor-like RCC1 family protein
MQVYAGGRHSLLVTDNGAVYSFGSNANGRTGFGTNVGDTLVASPIDTSNLVGKTIIQAAAGASHSLLLANDGSVFSFGANQFAQTGLGTSSGDTLLATPINTTNLGGKTILQVDAGGQNSLLLDSTGVVFAFGRNGNGQTGMNTDIGNTLVATPIANTNLGGKLITQVSVGSNHSLLLASDGSVFSFGSNQFAQTGLGTNVGNTLVATPIDTSNLSGHEIIQVSAGGSHSLLLADDGTVFSFGSNVGGRTGLGTDTGTTFVATPINTTNLIGKKIIQVSASDFTSLLLADDGTVFSFGFNTLGRTGQGTAVGSTLIATPIDMTNLTGLHVIGTSAGGDSSLLLAVPEPSTLLLLGVGAISLLGYRKSKTHG